MDTWAEERREVLHSVLDTLGGAGRASEDTAAGVYLLRHLLRTAQHPPARLRYAVTEDSLDERFRHAHPFS